MKAARSWLFEVVLPPLAFFALVVALWQAATVVWDVPAYLVPSPQRVWQAAREHAAELVSATRMTAGGALCGFGLSLVCGTVLGLIFAQSRIIERSVYPYAIFLQTVPIVAIAPLVVIWFGTGLASVVVVSFILSLFPIVTNATAGLTSVDPQLIELFTIYNASRAAVLFKLRLPHAVPYLVTGAKISCGLSVIGAIVGEIFAGHNTDSYGLGYLITMTTGRLETAYAFAAVLASTVLSIAVFAAVTSAGATILARWHTSEPGGSTTGR
ncbi:MAG TPA: ABC transporter permease [Pirellulales bacterium]|nr:ABC transporter permease [Pirellulales bacterium]